MLQKKNQRVLLLATAAAYSLIALEVLFMITPFALYFYGVYGPILEWLSANRTTAWATEFFLPHMVFINDPLLNTLAYLQCLFVIGLVMFFLAAVPLYYGRLTGKGVVTFGPYARLRHPQYLALAISGFGLLLYWPRFIVLIFYIIMLFVYYLLARNEEWRMKHEQPGNYDEYMKNTWMFLPGEPGGWLFSNLFGWASYRKIGLVFCFLVVLFSSIFAAIILRTYSLDRVTQVKINNQLLVSVYPRETAELTDLQQVVMSSAQAQALLNGRNYTLVYVMPGDFFLTGLILQEGPRFSEDVIKRFPHLSEKPTGRHDGNLVKFFRLGYKFYQTIGTTRRAYDYERLVFVEAVDLEGEPVHGERVFDMGVKRLPSLVVDIDSETLEVLYVSEVSGNNAWGRLPMPNL